MNYVTHRITQHTWLRAVRQADGTLVIFWTPPPSQTIVVDIDISQYSIARCCIKNNYCKVKFRPLPYGLDTCMEDLSWFLRFFSSKETIKTTTLVQGNTCEFVNLRLLKFSIFNKFHFLYNSKVLLEIPHKISYTYFERYVSYSHVEN